MPVKGVDVVGNSKSRSHACSARVHGLLLLRLAAHCRGQWWRNQHKSLCGLRATRLAANAGMNVGEKGEMVMSLWQG